MGRGLSTGAGFETASRMLWTSFSSCSSLLYMTAPERPCQRPQVLTSWDPFCAGRLPPSGGSLVRLVHHARDVQLGASEARLVGRQVCCAFHLADDSFPVSTMRRRRGNPGICSEARFGPILRKAPGGRCGHSPSSPGSSCRPCSDGFASTCPPLPKPPPPRPSPAPRPPRLTWCGARSSARDRLGRGNRGRFESVRRPVADKPRRR